MSAFMKEYHDLDHALDDLRGAVQEWSSNLDGRQEVEGETVHCACLVLHEWIANLHRHASFQVQSPTIKVRLSLQDRLLSCSVTDNSEGFDLETHLPSAEDPPEALPEGGMGLRIIRSCTDSLSYTTGEDGLQHFQFSIPFDHDPWMNTLF